MKMYFFVLYVIGRQHPFIYAVAIAAAYVLVIKGLERSRLGQRPVLKHIVSLALSMLFLLIISPVVFFILALLGHPVEW